MSRGTPQTSIRLSLTAAATLDEVAHERSANREATVRDLLTKYVEYQSQRPNEDHWLTHVSTVLHYPAGIQVSGAPSLMKRVAVRIPPNLITQAVRFSYRIPGHSSRQGHHDYGSRPLADAIATAIALEHQFQEPELAGLPDLLEHRVANGLWRLVFAASLTHGERQARQAGSRALQEALEDADSGISMDRAWHSAWRYQLAAHIARRLFAHADADVRDENVKWVGEQQDEFEFQLNELRRDDVIYGGHELTEDGPRLALNEEGRAATMLWRIEREASLRDFGAWLTAPDKPDELNANPPRWKLRMPEGWKSSVWPTSATPDSKLQRWIDDGRVLVIRHGSRTVAWPLIDHSPVLGFEHVLAGARQLPLKPEQIAEAILATRLAYTTEADDDADEPPSLPQVPPSDAHTAGLITEDERDALLQETAELTERLIQRLLYRTERYGLVTSDELEQLRAAASNPPRFRYLANQHGLRFWVPSAYWVWEVEPIPDALASSKLTPPQLQLLGREWCRRVGLALERDMQAAWHRAPWWMWHDDVNDESLLD